MSSLLDLPLADPGGPDRSTRPELRAVPDLPPLDFDAVVRRLTPRLQRYARRRLGDPHEAEELVQEALLRAYNHRASLATEDDVAAWSTCVTGRLVIDRLRVRGRSTCVADVPEGTRVGRDTADVVVARDEARLALDALDSMPPRQAAVLWAREVEGLAYTEIGARFLMTEPAVRSVLSRARKTLRKEFATRGGTLPAAGLVALAPWIDGLTWADRLRRTVVRATAPATLGIASLGLLTGAVSVPWSVPDSAPPSRSAVLVTEPAASAVVPHSTASNPVSSGPVADSAADVPTAPDPTAPGEASILERSGLNETCTGAGDASVGGAGCSPAPRNPVTPVALTLPDNPAGVTYVGVETDGLSCDNLLPGPALPVCVHLEGPPR